MLSRLDTYVFIGRPLEEQSVNDDGSLFDETLYGTQPVCCHQV
jgi:hypothetical protein